MPDLYCVCTWRQGRYVILEQHRTQEQADMRAAVMRERRKDDSITVAKMTAGIKKNKEEAK